MDSATEFLFGNCVHALSTPLSLPRGQRVQSADPSTASLTRFSDSFQVLTGAVGERAKANYPWELNEIFQDPVRRHMKVVNEYISPLIDTAIEKAKMKKSRVEETEAKGGDVDGDDLVTYLASQTDGA